MVGERGAGAIEDEHPQPAPHRAIIEAAMQTNDLTRKRMISPVLCYWRKQDQAIAWKFSDWLKVSETNHLICNELRMARLVYQSFLKATKATVEDR